MAKSPQEAAAPPNQNQAIGVSNEEVKAFANAQTRLQEIGDSLNTRLQGMHDPEEMREVQSRAQEEMITAVEDSGLTINRYNSIATAARIDSDLAKRIQDAK